MRIETLISLCKMYAKEGWSVQEQLDSVMAGEDLSEQNPNALKLMQRFLERAEEENVENAGDLAELIRDHLDSPVDQGDL